MKHKLICAEDCEGLNIADNTYNGDTWIIKKQGKFYKYSLFLFFLLCDT